jgi:hypothetical protein
MVCYAIFAASLRPAFQALQHQRQPERDAEVDHVDTGGRLFELRGDVSPMISRGDLLATALSAPARRRAS